MCKRTHRGSVQARGPLAAGPHCQPVQLRQGHHSHAAYTQAMEPGLQTIRGRGEACHHRRHRTLHQHHDLLTALRFHLSSMPQTNISPTERVVDIANHVLSSNVFSFEDYFQQIFGTAMGTPMAPSAPNLFMGWLEVQLLASSPVPVSQDTWKRFIDDIFLLWTGTPEDSDVFFQHINSFYPTIKFTIASSADQLPFLDILISLKDDFLNLKRTSIPNPQIPTPTSPTAPVTPTMLSRTSPTASSGGYDGFARTPKCSTPAVTRCRGTSCVVGHHLKNVQEARARERNTPHRSETLQHKLEQSTNRTPFTHSEHCFPAPSSKLCRDLVTPLKGHSLSLRSCPATRSAPSERFGY